MILRGKEKNESKRNNNIFSLKPSFSRKLNLKSLSSILEFSYSYVTEKND